jgi:CheY-like chemotaxis protein
MKTILLIENSEDDVFFFKRALQRKGITHPVQVVNDGQAATDYLDGTGLYADRQQYPLPDLIFLGIQLPKRNGHELLEWLRNNSRLPRFPVVLLTSSVNPPDVESAYRLGTNAYLVKPGNPEKLEAMLDRTINFWLEVNAPPILSGMAARVQTASA